MHACQEDEREILAVQLIGEEDHQFAKISAQHGDRHYPPTIGGDI
ncbi:MAG: hypothetical protein WDN04_05760 [Rhodospirillales bacterium]